MKHIVIVGGGTGGIMTAAQLLKVGNVKVSLIEPADFHYYQPAWTLVGANTYDFEKTKRPMGSVMPVGVSWVKGYAQRLLPETNEIELREGDKISYDYLVLSPGVKIDTSLVEGLTEAIDKGVVCSNYTDPKHTWEVIKNFKGGTALFTQPTTPIKCGGAPQKIMYLADDYFQKSGVKNKTKLVYATNGGVIFGIKPIANTLMEVVNRKKINLRFGHQLVKVDGEKQIAWYKMGDNQSEHNHLDVETSQDGELIGIHFDMMHLAPPQTAPDFIKNSPLANEAGWIDVNIRTMQHNRFENVFGIGDAAALPTAKTGAAIRKQVPIVVENINRLIAGQEMSEKEYNGYSSCPLVTGYGKMVLAEFDYDGNFTPDPKLKQMLVFDSSKEHRRLWWLKKYILPRLYWNKMLKGINV